MKCLALAALSIALTLPTLSHAALVTLRHEFAFQNFTKPLGSPSGTAPLFATVTVTHQTENDPAILETTEWKLYGGNVLALEVYVDGVLFNTSVPSGFATFTTVDDDREGYLEARFGDGETTSLEGFDVPGAQDYRLIYTIPFSEAVEEFQGPSTGSASFIMLIDGELWISNETVYFNAQAVPLPAAAWFFGSAVLGLAFARTKTAD